METNRRFTLLPFPQFFDGNTLTLNIVVMPRNQNPLRAAIERNTPPIPDAPAFADAGDFARADLRISCRSGNHNTVPAATSRLIPFGNAFGLPAMT